jgi:ProP effector
MVILVVYTKYEKDMTFGEPFSKKDKILVVDWLIENFPQTFFKKAKQVKPLQIGIFDEIIEFYERLDNPPFSKKALREALNFYSSSPAYLLCQKVNTARVDIFGNEVDIVNDDQAKYAYQRYQERYEKTDASNKKKSSKNSDAGDAAEC